MGLNASSDEWCARSDAALEGLEKTRKIVDDILVWASSWEELCERVRSVLERCKQHGITLSRDKMQMGSEVRFAGHVISPKGSSRSQRKSSALKNFPAPTDADGACARFWASRSSSAGFVP
jgi:hypothetical protein